MENNGYSAETLDTFKTNFFRTQKEETLVKHESFGEEEELGDDINLEKRKFNDDPEDLDSSAKRQKLEGPESLWIRDDETLPEGWLLAKSNGGEIIKNNEGEEFSGRKEAIDFMIKEGFSPEGIFKLWNTLHLDGWLDDPEHLPTGWKKKSFSGTFHFLSPLMEEITGTEALLEHLQRNISDYDSHDVNKVKKWISDDAF